MSHSSTLIIFAVFDKENNHVGYAYAFYNQRIPQMWGVFNMNGEYLAPEWYTLHVQEHKAVVVPETIQ